MKQLLSPDNAEVLAQLAWSRVLLAFDFDGTLAPIVSRRDHASMRPRTLRLFEGVCALYPCAVISGRATADVARRLGEARVRHVVGNHGLEPGRDLTHFEADVARARVALERALAPAAGVDVEDKRYSLALHYRRSRAKRRARAAIHAAVAALPVPMRVIPGKQAVNVVPGSAPNKGDALLKLRRAEHADTALYLGDDVTDEDVFKLDQPGRLFTVRVGRSLASAAAYYVPKQADVDRLLARLLALRQKPPRHGPQRR